jgi:hypothetical protein
MVEERSAERRTAVTGDETGTAEGLGGRRWVESGVNREVQSSSLATHGSD